MATVFFSYAHADEPLRNALEVHLAALKRQGLIETLHDRRIVAGAPVDDSIDAYLESADVILCLVSPEFIDSEYCYSREMKRALERHHAGDAVVVPVILRYCEWQKTPLGELRATPRDGKPVKAWSDQDEALNDVAKDIRRAVEARSQPRAARPLATTGAPAAPAAPRVRERPRSANLHVRRALTDRERDDYVDAAFEFTLEFFANSLAELEGRNPQLSVKLTHLDARRFTAATYLEGSKVSAITVFAGGAFGQGNAISFNNADHGDTSSSNGAFVLDDQRDNLRFRPLFGAPGLRNDSLDLEGVAEAIWSSFIGPLQR
ncbi:MAG TPA: toll/interleukin-1 receptor domain-containing protein [Caulobacteraceae bacterium]|nr:toll/interleukin-1 receptor domain-containing protein [Caulobacteraceae bacterium]